MISDPSIMERTKIKCDSITGRAIFRKIREYLIFKVILLYKEICIDVHQITTQDHHPISTTKMTGHGE